MTNTLIPKEIDEQAMVCQYLELLKTRGHKIIYTATAQSTYTKSWSQKAQNKKLGVHRGLPDLVVIIDDTLVFLEIKRLKMSTTSAEQKVWNQHLKESGNHAYICKGASEAINILNDIIQVQKCLKQSKKQL